MTDFDEIKAKLDTLIASELETQRLLRSLLNASGTSVGPSGRGRSSHDRERLDFAKSVLADLTASRGDVSEAIAKLQSTDDPDPEFMVVHDALMVRHKAFR